jgi:hypothetical protein
MSPIDPEITVPSSRLLDAVRTRAAPGPASSCGCPQDGLRTLQDGSIVARTGFRSRRSGTRGHGPRELRTKVMRADQVMSVVEAILRDLDSSLLGPVLAAGEAGTLRRQREAMLLERAVADLAASLPLPGFRSRLAWQLPPRRTQPGAPPRDETLALRACRIARRLWKGVGLPRSSSRFDTVLMQLIPGAGGAEIRLAALGTMRPAGDASPAAEASRSAGARLLAALAVIVVALRQIDRGTAGAVRQPGVPA